MMSFSCEPYVKMAAVKNDEVSSLLIEYTTLKRLVDAHKMKTKRISTKMNNPYRLVKSTSSSPTKHAGKHNELRKFRYVRSPTKNLLAKVSGSEKFKDNARIISQTSPAFQPTSVTAITPMKRRTSNESDKSWTPASNLRKKILSKYKITITSNSVVYRKTGLNQKSKSTNKVPSKYLWTANKTAGKLNGVISNSPQLKNSIVKTPILKSKYWLTKVKVSPSRSKLIKSSSKLRTPKNLLKSPSNHISRLSYWTTPKAKFNYRVTNNFRPSNPKNFKTAKHWRLKTGKANKCNQHKIINVNGTKFTVNDNRLNLRKRKQTKIMSEGIKDNKNISSTPTLKSKSPNHMQHFANRAINRSIFRLNVAKQKSKTFCLFYNKFGNCKKYENGTCPYIHDPDKIAICKRFLRGNCTIDKCPFSHIRCRSKMPACTFFLNGSCHNGESCNYSHVNVGRDAAICFDFANGYCADGDKCKKWHLTHCKQFERTGLCNREKCPLVHKKKTTDQSSSSSIYNKLKNPLTENHDLISNVKIKWEGPSNPLPAFIPISDYKEPTVSVSGLSNSTLQIRPNFLLTGKRKSNCQLLYFLKPISIND